MYKNFDSSKPYFRGVALLFILSGAGILALGLAQWWTNTYFATDFYLPSYKVMGGLIIAALGYVHLELELIRVGRTAR